MKSERVFITGCGGMLGSAIYPFFASRYEDVLASDRIVNEKWLVRLDVRDDDHLARMFKEYRPDIVLHLAAETNLEYCETHPEITIATNAVATRNIAKLSEEYGAMLIYISTAGVFDGKKSGFYTEEDQPNPIMVYGRTKYEGELYALEHCSRTFVVRAGWMMGGGRDKEKKFIFKILEQVAQGKKEIFAVNDKWGTPTYTYDFAMNLFRLMETEKYGTYHMVCEGEGSRYDVAEEILKICGISDIDLVPVGSGYFEKEYFAPRPRSEIMSNANLGKHGINFMRPWRESLSDYIKNYFFDFMRQPGLHQKERRKHRREDCGIPVTYSIKGEAGNILYSGILIDKCVSGAGIITGTALQAGQIIVFRDKEGTLTPDAGREHSLCAENSFRVGLESLNAGHFSAVKVLQVKTKDFFQDNEVEIRRLNTIPGMLL